MSGIGLERCSECGIPEMVGRLVTWERGGIMNFHANPNLRMAIFSADVHTGAVREIEDTLDLSIKDLLFLAEKNVGWNYLTELIGKVPDLRSMKEPEAKKSVADEMRRILLLLGHGCFEMAEYVPGEGSRAYVRNPFNLDLVAAVIVSTLEQIEEHHVDYEWEQKGDAEYLIKTRLVHSRLETVILPEKEPLPVLSGDMELELCPVCNSPRILGENFKWEEDRGTIRDMRTGRRYIMLSTSSLKTLFDELSLEFGDEIYDILVKAQRDWTYNHIESIGFSMYEPHDSEGFQTFFIDYLNVFPVFGYGNPVSFATDDAGIGIVVENPCNEHMIAGILQGLCESLSQEPSAVSWNETDQGITKYSIVPRC